MKVFNEETQEWDNLDPNEPMEVGKYYQLCDEHMHQGMENFARLEVVVCYEDGIDFENVGGRPENIKQDESI